MDIKKTAERLTNLYIKKFSINERWQRRHSFLTIKAFLDSDKYTEEFVEASILDYKEYFDEAPEFIETIFKEPILRHKSIEKEYPSDNGNLLIRGRFYYHPRLCRIPGPPVMRLKDDGSVEFELEDFYLEIIEKFAVEDLMDYFYEKTKQIKDNVNRNRDIGGLKYMLKRYPLDVILYAIDNTVALCYDLDIRVPTSPLEIEDYMQDAWDIYYQKVTCAMVEGLNKEIPKESRNGRN